ncbi:hypothetical protein EF847_16055 [Actinobacteria bacterium YIM 96077]|uniref:CRISPR-associated protein n=1 Tax=Phytoactinopolyspora halophila TaxID=1981511 RepID=A0A329QCK5_9ACTN|nr:hypothetical protein [Phytoactinopolyspora halophila]AYY13989.1 hypothetical protein EF847_16055 [Actinobacteria bacterium YIM 96077]RAW10034.1 hypothetical protein DPM12_19760 [Phytoactinopolyspora halophila]
MLIATVGGNAVPVWLALKERRPDRCVLVHTAESERVAERIRKQTEGIDVTCCRVGELPTFDEFDHALSEYVGASEPVDGVDITGGTKLMAVLAAEWAERRGVSMHDFSYVAGPRLLRDFARGSTVIKTDLSTDDFLNLQRDNEVSSVGVPPEVRPGGGAHAEARAFFQRKLNDTSLPPPSSLRLPSAGGTDWNELFSEKRGHYRWMELATQLAAELDPKLSHVRGNVTVKSPEGKSDLEVDVVAVRDNQLILFSVTTNPLLSGGSKSFLSAKATEKLTEAAVRARHLGGEFARAVLVTPDEARSVKCARELLSQLLPGDDPVVLLGATEIASALDGQTSLSTSMDRLKVTGGRPSATTRIRPAGPAERDLVLAVGENPIPVAEAIRTRKAREVTLVYSAATESHAVQVGDLVSRGNVAVDGIRLADPHDPEQVHRDLHDSGVVPAAVDLTGGTKPMVVQLSRWARSHGDGITRTYIPARHGMQRDVDSRDERKLNTPGVSEVITASRVLTRPPGSSEAFGDDIAVLTNVARIWEPSQTNAPSAPGPSPANMRPRRTCEWVTAGADVSQLWRLFLEPDGDPKARSRDFRLLVLEAQGWHLLVGDVVQHALKRKRTAIDKPDQAARDVIRETLFALDVVAAAALGSAAVPVVIAPEDVIGDSPHYECRRELVRKLRDDWDSPRSLHVVSPTEIENAASRDELKAILLEEAL